MSFAEKRYRHGVQWVTLDEKSGTARVEQLPYEPQRALVSIPDSGALRPAELAGAIAALPRRHKDDDGSCWPYVELRVAEEQPEPGLLREVGAALADRAALFCRMVREQPGAAPADDAPATVEALQTLSPLDMARLVFRERYGADMPEALTERFKRAEEAAAETDD